MTTKKRKRKSSDGDGATYPNDARRQYPVSSKDLTRNVSAHRRRALLAEKTKALTSPSDFSSHMIKCE